MTPTIIIYKQDNGIPKVCTALLLGEYLLHYTCFKDKDLCVAIATDVTDSPFAIKQIMEAVLALR